VTGGPWRSLANGWQRIAGADVIALTVYPSGVREWHWDASDEVVIIEEGDEPTLPAAMEAADLWASENGYPAVRVEVDP
jgi:hypothetical protein